MEERVEGLIIRDINRDTRKQGFPGHFKELLKELTVIITTVRSFFNLKPENTRTWGSAVRYTPMSS